MGTSIIIWITVDACLNFYGHLFHKNIFAGIYLMLDKNAIHVHGKSLIHKYIFFI